MERVYKICKRCVMDNASDSTITFNDEGFCNYCTKAHNDFNKIYFPNQEGKERLLRMISLLKREGKGKKFDCLMGLSGGLDSSYLAYLGATQWNLRIMGVHIDDGFDTDIAKNNIKNLCNKCGIELITIQPDAEQFNDLTKAYILAEVPNIAIPQDNVLFAYLYDWAKKYKVKYFLSGSNFALESILQVGNTHNAFDLTNLMDIHSKFGTKPIEKLNFLTNKKKRVNQYFNNIQTFLPLNYIDYNKLKAIDELAAFSGFTYYKAKHLENTLTKIIQLSWFYNKFNVDKRRSHFSSLIVSGQMSRDEALFELSKPVYDRGKMVEEERFVLEKLGISYEEFHVILNRDGKQHNFYKTEPKLNFLNKLMWKIIHILFVFKNSFR